jgi:hypothetical protein
MSGDLLGDEEAAAQVGVEDEVPVVPGDLECGFADVASGVVDEDVDLADGFVGRGGHGLNAFLIAYVEGEGDGAAAEGFDLRDEWEQVVFAAAGEDEVCAGFGEGACEILAEATAGPGDDGDLAGEIEE